MTGISSISRASYPERQVSGSQSRQFTEEEQKRIDELKKIDTQVRAHEAAHQAAAGGLARGKSFTYTTGPDGGQYAVGGEVQIDTSPIPNNPQATISKMQQVQRAALAPADPSGQDMAVAAQAAAAAQQARTENSQPNEQSSNENSSNENSPLENSQNKNSPNKRTLSLAKSYATPAPVGSLYSAREMCTSCQVTTSCGHLSVS